jgi:hypothetical protein
MATEPPVSFPKKLSFFCASALTATATCDCSNSAAVAKKLQHLVLTALLMLCSMQLPEDDEEQRRYPRFGKRGAPQAFATKLFELLKHEPPEIVGWTDAGQPTAI